MSWSDYFGIFAAIFFFSSLLYAWRRRSIEHFLSRKMGNAYAWRIIHVYLGNAFAFSMIWHTKATLPDGAFSWWLYLLSWWIIITGTLGWYLERWIPKKITASTQTEIIYERIPPLCDHLRAKCEKIAETCPAILAEFYNRAVASFMTRPMFISPIDAVQDKLSMFSQLEAIRLRLPDERRNEVDQMLDAIKVKFDLDAHYTLQTILRLWIYAHAPTAFLLAILIVFHIFAVIYY
jgi:hypothetical protein